MENIQGHFCPVCKHKNEPDAVLCAYCGASLEADSAGKSPRPQRRSARPQNVFPKEPLRIKTDALIPEDGIAIFLLDNPKPIATLAVDEFILGRPMEGSLEEIVDLTSYGAFAGGVSRRHAMVAGRITASRLLTWTAPTAPGSMKNA